LGGVSLIGFAPSSLATSLGIARAGSQKMRLVQLIDHLLEHQMQLFVAGRGSHQRRVRS